MYLGWLNEEQRLVVHRRRTHQSGRYGGDLNLLGLEREHPRDLAAKWVGAVVDIGPSSIFDTIAGRRWPTLREAMALHEPAVRRNMPSEVQQTYP
ncbi:hypothetical protein CFN78_25605 [Amycolatopsis antarctica]|uniref:Uncharacterized protein n=1 Tax=Amycolatopsis antarctica TaxID=1854586 RepID=A0A263CY10_9PSEU|nr:hypothetical protein CFN78_25605 [Amycolatopsis antarctica]